MAWVEGLPRGDDSPEHVDTPACEGDDGLVVAFSLTRVWRRIPERGGRALRVVFRPAGADIVVVTAFFDRGARRWLPT
jgi:hypothetical protein